MTDQNRGAYSAGGYNAGGYNEPAEKPIDYKYYLFLFKKNFYVIMTFFIIVITLAAIYATKIPEKYQTVTQLMIERPKLSWANIKEGGAPGAEGESVSAEYFNTQMQIMVSPPVIQQVVDQLRLGKYFGVSNENAVKIVIKMVSVRQVTSSRLFNITITGPSARFVVQVANALARAYIRKNFEEQLYYSKELLNWLPEKGAPTDLVTVGNEITGFKQMTREEIIENLPSVKLDPTLRNLKEKANELQSELQLDLQRYREKHPVVVKVKANIKFVDDNIASETKRILQALKSEASGEHRLAQVRVIQEAVLPESPLPSNRLRLVLIAALAELILSFFMIILLDHFDDTIHSFDDLERRGLTLPFLGPIPVIKGAVNKGDPSRKALAGYYDKASGIAESFRYLRVAINFSATPEALKTLVITSCLPHEGKSFVSHNIAVSLAQDGNRTLIIDGDMRRPTLDRVFKLDNSTGLSNYLTSNLEVTSVLKETFIENLIALPSGPMSPNPGEILASEKMKTLLEKVRGQFDRVIIDCPPLTGIGDGFVIGNIVGHVILVIAANKTPTDLIRHTNAQLDRAKIKLIGVILNMVDMEKERFRGYSKHYYHTYNRYYQVSEGGG